MAIVNAPDGQVILVDSDGNTVGTFASIQDAVNAAGAADDVIYVGNGSYSVAALTANLTLDVENKTVSVGDLTGSGTIELAAGGSLTVGSDGASTTFKGAVTGANLNTDGLVKTGSGTLTLQNTTVTDTSVYVAGGEVDSKGTNAIDYLAVGEGGGNTGTFGISSGSLTVGNTVQGALQVGDFGGTGTFNQSGGTVTDDGAFNVGNQGGTGSYNLSGGKLVLTGGNIDVIGRNTNGHAASNGTVAISGGLLDLQSGSELILGNNTNSAAGNGQGQIIQTGGTLEIEAGNHLYLSAAGNGEYDLNGGTLEVGGSNSLVQNYNGLGGTGSFNLGGGTIKVTGSELVTNVNATLTAGSTSTIDVGTLGADFTGAVTGAGNLDIAGSGVATFAHLATTGELNLEGGTLDVGSSTASVGDLTGSGTIELAAGGSLTVGSDGASTTFKGAVTGANLNTDGLVKTGSGTLTLQNTTVTDTSVYVAGGEVDSKGTNAIDYLAVGEGGGNTGTFGISSGSLTVGNTVQGALQVGDFGGTGTFNQSGGTVTDDGAFNVGNQGGTGSYNLSGGKLVLTGGNIDVIGRNTNGHAASNGTVAISGGLLDLQSGSELILGNNTNSAAGNGQGQIIQTGGTLEIEAGNHLYLSAAGNGEYDLNGGTLEVGGSNSLVQNYNGLGGTGSFNLGGGTIKVTGSELVTNVNATLTAGSTSTIDVGTLGADFTGAVTGSGNLDIAGSGVATFAHLATTGELNLEGGTLDVGSSTASVGDLTGSGTIELAAGGSLTVGSDGASTTFKGAVTGANLNTDGLVKTGSGTLTLQNTTVTDASVYVAGGEVDSKGTNSIDYLAVGEGGGNTGTFGISSGSLTVGNTVQGALQVGDFGGTGTFNQSGGTVTDDGAFNVGNQGGTGTYNLSGGKLVLTGGNIDVIGRNTASAGKSASNGTVAISGGLLDLQSGSELILGNNTNSPAGNGHGQIIQTGGTLEIEAGNHLYLSAAGNGEYDLNGGTLEVGGSNSLVQNYNGLGGTGSFNLGGGTIKVTGSELVTNVNATLTAGSTSTIDVGTLGADFTGKITGSGSLEIEGTAGVATLGGINDFSGGVIITGGTLELANAQAAGTGAITFQNAPVIDPTLQIDGSVLPTNVIDGFGAGDVIDLADIANQAGSSADFDYVNHVLHITEGGTTYQLNFDPSQNFAGEFFHLASDGNGTAITVDHVACYCLGTLISTDRGDVAVEDLVIGDHVVTAAGASRPIKWIGQRSYGGRFLIGRRDLLPVCFKAGSLGEALPRRDLLVSPKHAMFIDGVLIPAEHLINGVSVVQLEQVDSVSYFHVELESHDVLLAEGAPSESFVDDESRGMFHNAHEFAKLYPDAEQVRASYYAPRIENGYELEAARRRIAARAGLAVSPSASMGSLCGQVDYIGGSTVQGWALNAARPEAPLCLDVLVDGVIVAQMLANQYRDDLAKAGIGSGHHGFAVELPAALLPKQLALLEVRRSLDGAVLRQSLCAVEAEAAAA